MAACAFTSACAAGSRGAPATPSPEGGQLSAPPASDVESDANRWGYNPGKATGLPDPPPTYEALPPGYRVETYARGLDRPTAITFARDGTLLVAEQGGAIRIVQDGSVRRQPYYVVDAYRPGSGEGFSELGLVGLAVEPSSGDVFAYYATDVPQRRTVLARIRDDGGLGGGLEEVLSIDAAPACCHIAGSLRFAPDGTLFVMVGDHQMEPQAQDRGSVFGAALRITTDGSAAIGSPFAGDALADARVYAYGLRNPYDVAIDPLSGRIFATENGYKGQDAIVELKPGANYGWPGSGLSVPLDEIEQPLLFYHNTIGPSGADFYRGRKLPALDGSLLFCQFHHGGALHRVSFAGDGSVAGVSIIAPGCTSDVQTGPDGFVYFADYVGGVVYRIAR